MCSTGKTDPMCLQDDQMTDQELKEWQQMQINKCRIENIFNKVTEIYRYLEALQAGQDPPEQFNIELEESAILMAIGAYGLVGINNFRSVDSFQYYSDITNSLQNEIVHSSVNQNAIIPDTLNALHNYQLLSPRQSSVLPISSTNSRCNVNNDSPESDSINLFEATTLTNSNNDNSEHQQFVEAAISAAIQKQGLGLIEPKR